MIRVPPDLVLSPMDDKTWPRMTMTTCGNRNALRTYMERAVSLSFVGRHPHGLPRAPPAEEAQAELLSGLDVDLVSPQVASPVLLSFPSCRPFLLQEQNMPALFAPRQEQFRSMN